MKTIKEFSMIKFLLVCLSLIYVSCSPKEQSMEDVIEHGLKISVKHALAMAQKLENEEGKLPKTAKDGKLVTSNCYWWCSGFYPGVLWYLYEYDHNPQLKKYAELFTERLDSVQYVTDNHDVGFMLNCSYGNGYRITNNEQYKNVLIQGAKSLITRYNPKVGAIRSWDTTKGGKWQYAVIIDNMMNLELLTKVSNMTNDSVYESIAINHADKTLNNHFRDDYSCYHVISYDTISGNLDVKDTHQGYDVESVWTRGQAWALYGYAMMARETGEERYLEQAKHVADFMMNHPKMPADKIPYWDFECPDIPNTTRDASAAAIMASGLIELSQLDNSATSAKYLKYAEEQIRSLTSPEYLAAEGTNCDFILKHSTGFFKRGSEVDAPLTYADYYYVEALMRLKSMYEKK